MDASDIITQLRSFICEQLLHRPADWLDADTPLITGGLLDSFALAHIGVFIEDAFGVYVPDNELTVANMDTLSLMVDRILAAGAAS